jgi:hypothetical protein
MALGSTQPLTEMSTRNLLRGTGWAAREDDLTAISEPIFWKMWELWCLTTLWAFPACCRDSFTFFYNTLMKQVDFIIDISCTFDWLARLFNFLWLRNFYRTADQVSRFSSVPSFRFCYGTWKYIAVISFHISSNSSVRVIQRFMNRSFKRSVV